jgi:uncharacterized membrane protein YgcG
MRAVRRLVRILLATGAVVLLGAVPSARAQGFVFESTPSFNVDIEIQPSGNLLITETIVQEFGSTPRHGIFRYIPNRVRYDDRYDRVYPIDLLDVTASPPGTPDDVETKDENGNFVIRIGDPDTTVTGRHTYTITYTVRGAMNGFPDHDELYWNAIGTQWEQDIGQMRVRVEGPSAIEKIACFAGWYGSTDPCTASRIKAGIAQFAESNLPSGNAMTVVTSLPPNSVANTDPILDERWSLSRAFSATPATVGGASALGAFVVVGFGWLMWRRARDVRYRGSQIDQVMGGPVETEVQTVPLFEKGEGPVEFAPPENLRPGEVGTLIDEEANTLDVTATIIDLAVRKFLRIEEIEKTWFLGKPDWKLTRLEPPAEELLTYERKLLDGVFETGDEVLLSELKKTFATRLQKVKDALYSDVVAHKWFLKRPDRIRQTWTGIGVLALILGIASLVVLAIFTHEALLGVPLVLGGLLMVAGAHRMPRRTARGTAMTRRVNGFRRVIETADRYTAKWAEQENVFTKYLAYAVVFDVTEKWAKAFEGLGQGMNEDMSWYVGSRPFVYGEFAQSIGSFAVTTSGTISATPAGSGGSGFGGGGFSGGGGGGGGGGSW